MSKELKFGDMASVSTDVDVTPLEAIGKKVRYIGDLPIGDLMYSIVELESGKQNLVLKKFIEAK